MSLRNKNLGTKAQRQESASAGIGGRKNRKLHPVKGQRTPGNVTLDNSTPGGPVTLPPNADRLAGMISGCKPAARNTHR